MDNKTIEQIAYRIWEEQGKPDGLDFEHWLQARKELGEDSDGPPGSVSSSVSPPAASRQEDEPDAEVHAELPSAKTYE
jgi:hypothetical protein